MTIDGLTLRCLTQELDAKLKGSRVQQIYHPQPNMLTLKLYAAQFQEEFTLIIGFDNPPWFHISKAHMDNPISPSSFCMLLRKHVKNGFVDSIRQDGLERIVDILIRRPEKVYNLKVELLGNRGNAMLLLPKKSPHKLNVLGAAVQRPTRRLPPGTLYKAPDKQDKLNPEKDEKEKFLNLAREDEPVWRWMLNHIEGIGPRLAKELVLRTGLDLKTPANQLDDVAINSLWGSTQQLFGHLEESLSPCTYFKDGEPFDASPFPLQVYEDHECQQMESLSQAFDACLQIDMPNTEEQSERHRILKHLKDQVKKTKSALDHVAADLHRAKQFEVIRKEADVIMANLHELEAGSEKELIDLETGEPLQIKIDPRLTPIEAAQKKYARYKKLKRGVDKLTKRQKTLSLELEYFQTAQTQVEQAEAPEDLDALAEELGIRKKPDPRKKPVEPHGPRRYEESGYIILVGRNSRQNDELTKSAQPEDLWLHARERPGSHVVIKTNGDAESVPDEVRLRAAQLAAYYSKGREATKVPVICTRAKFLRKPRGAKPGLVLVTKEDQTLLVSPMQEETV